MIRSVPARDTFAVSRALFFIFCILPQSLPALGMAKKPAPVAHAMNGRKVVAIDPVLNVRIEMPDGEFHDFGGDFQGRLTTLLHQSGRYRVADPPGQIGPLGVARESLVVEPLPEYGWPGSTVPSATLKIKVEALSFQTGSRGERMFYGFNERFRTPFNNGFNSEPNEFPLRAADEGDAKHEGASWFDGAFDGRGVAPFDSRSGLDLGDGFGIDVLFAWLSVKYALYHSELRLRLDIDAPLAGRREFRQIGVRGEGYFFDISGAYNGFSAGIRLARRDAMDQALKNAIDGAFEAVDRAVSDLPLTGKIDHVLPDGIRLIGTGIETEVQPGVVYEVIGHPETRLEVLASDSMGVQARVVQGDPANASDGMMVREALEGLGDPNLPNPGTGLAPLPGLPGIGVSVSALKAMPEAPSSPAVVESIQLPWKNLEKSDLSGLAPVVSGFMAFLKSIEEALLLPYRIWRYYAYDQVYHTHSDAGVSATQWAANARASGWGKQIGLDRTPDGASGSPIIVAVIDSGVDYNHPVIHPSLWLNPAPVPGVGEGPSARSDYYGWDFISGDAHAYDDGYHGTEVASVVLAVAPQAKILPVKVFNPWGITSSAALYGAFEYAVQHGARVIVCGWATRVSSRALKEGVAYARANGVLVVAAAGDRGEVLSRNPAYPAALSASFDNVLTVTSVDRHDQILKNPAVVANTDPSWVGIAAPGKSVRAATPRGATVLDSSTGLAAAQVAGAVARMLANSPQNGAGPAVWISRLRGAADHVPSLESAVSGGLRLHVRW